MASDRWQRIIDVFQTALDRDAASRQAFLDEACGDDAALRAEVEVLLVAHKEAGSFGERPLTLPAAEGVHASSTPMRGSLTGAADSEHCSHCGTDLISEPGIPGWCPQCLLGLALLEPGGSFDLLRPGRVIGNRYQLVETLGRGGMGEVVRAFDLKLRVQVALKAVRGDRVGNERAREALRQEVRAAREVVSPNVCRIFDLVIDEDEELVSMEYIDGTTLAETLRRRGPLEFHETRDIAFQFLAGLDAIHRAGLVHRDFKPENIMITTAGRVVVMDFGLASNPTEGSGRTISGTPAYMAPEQTRGDGVDARADVFSAGVVLAEMLMAGEGGSANREAVWRAVRETPPRVAEGPWAPVLRQALSPIPESRYESAHALARALETITQRLQAFDGRRPYPGLAPFSLVDAAYFFGREVETERLLKKLERPRLLALIGPSGAGKSSFLHAGLLPTLSELWKVVVVTPGNEPFQSLAHGLAPHLSGDTDSIKALLRFDEDTAVRLFQRFRQPHESALLIVDQFEELFTLCPVHVHAAFATLLQRLVVEADIRVIVSMRDDFLIQCQAHDALAPAFNELTALGPLSESDLRRALVQPALACGYRFEDEPLLDEMIRDVRQERGALPLLAFAASALWDRRDQATGLLTRTAYREINGVAGALAQHAEVTLERIGRERIPQVRELFRNLVTSQGTRAVRDREELLSIFDSGVPGIGSRVQAEEVIDALVNARLLNAYRGHEEDAERQKVEIVHESLLTAWPRLVQWRTQDAEGAQIRDQLRQAAQLWHERSRSDDLLWTGSTYRELVLWKERYHVALSAVEAAFVKASARRNTRRRRQMQLAAAALLVIATAVSIVTSALWQQSEASRRQAEAEARRAEAGKLLVMGERELDRDPTAALAYTIKSLELTDTEAGRHFAIRLLQRAPVAQLVGVSQDQGSGNDADESIDFGPSGEWVAWGGTEKVEMLHRDGRQRVLLGDFRSERGRSIQVRFAPAGGRLVATRTGEVAVWSIPDGRELRRERIDLGRQSFLRMGRDRFLTIVGEESHKVIRSWPLGEGVPRLVGSMDLSGRLDANEQVLAYSQGNDIYLRSLQQWEQRPRLIAHTGTTLRDIALSPDATRIAATDATRAISIWPTTEHSNHPERVVQSPGAVVGLGFDPSARWLFAVSFERGYPMLALFDLQASAAAEPIVLHKGDTNRGGGVAFDPAGHWLATTHGSEVAFWPLNAPRGQVIANGLSAPSLLFSADGTRLLALLADRSVQERSLGTGPSRTIVSGTQTGSPVFFMTGDRAARLLAVSGGGGRLSVIHAANGMEQALHGFPENSVVGRPAFTQDGRRVAAGLLGGTATEKVVRVWDLESGAVRVYGPWPGAGEQWEGGIESVHFVQDDRLYASIGGKGIAAIDLTSGASRFIVSQPISEFVVSGNGRVGVGRSGLPRTSTAGDSAVRFDLEDGSVLPLPSHGNAVTAVALDPGGNLIATGSFDGTIRIGPITGEEPHLVLGQQGEGAIYSLAFSPDGRSLAASGESFTVHVWPVPDTSRPPMHMRSHDELLAVLRSHSNLVAVPDSGVPNGYRLERGPFSGWETLPAW